MSDSTPNKAPVETPVEVYARIYKSEFDLLSSDMKERVISCKNDPNKKDRLVDEWVNIVITKAEAILDRGIVAPPVTCDTKEAEPVDVI